MRFLHKESVDIAFYHIMTQPSYSQCTECLHIKFLNHKRIFNWRRDRNLTILMSNCLKYYLWSVKEIHKTLENCRKNNLSFFLGAAPCSKRPRQDAGGHRAVQPVQPGVLLRYSTNAFLHRIHARFELIILWNFRLRPQEYKYFQ